MPARRSLRGKRNRHLFFEHQPGERGENVHRNSTSATSLTLASTGIVNLTGAGTVLQVNSLSNNGTIDVQSNEMLINYTPGFDPFSAIF